MENLNGWIQLMSEKIEFKGLIFLACSDVTINFYPLFIHIYYQKIKY